jgi:hypothetical protein
MGGGREIPTLISTSAIVAVGTTIANPQRIVPTSNCFIVSPPCPPRPTLGHRISRDVLIGPAAVHDLSSSHHTIAEHRLCQSGTVGWVMATGCFPPNPSRTTDNAGWSSLATLVIS